MALSVDANKSFAPLLVETSANIIESLWSQVPPHLLQLPAPVLRKFIAELLLRSKESYSTVYLSLLYPQADAGSDAGPIPEPEHVPRRPRPRLKVPPGLVLLQPQLAAAVDDERGASCGSPALSATSETTETLAGLEEGNLGTRPAGSAELVCCCHTHTLTCTSLDQITFLSLPPFGNCARSSRPVHSFHFFSCFVSIFVVASTPHTCSFFRRPSAFRSFPEPACPSS